MPADLLTSKGRHTRQAIERAAPKLFEMSDEDAITTLSTVWKKALYGA